MAARSEVVPDSREKRPGPLHRTAPEPRQHSSRWRAYVALTKPRIIVLLLVTTVPSIVLAAGGWPGTALVAVTTVAGAVAAGGANAFNMYLDRDIDAVMLRTADRPLVTGHITPKRALVFASLLSVMSVTVLTVATTVAAGALTAAAIVLYVVLYTMVLKRRTRQNIVWGGVAGCMPALIGWAAVTGSLSLAPALLFAVVFLWTPAHCWPLSLVYRQDYTEAGVPMLPTQRSAESVARRVVAYACGLLTLVLALPLTTSLGAIYLAVAGTAGTWFAVRSVGLLVAARKGAGVQRRAMNAFRASIAMLAATFIAVAVDVLAG